MTADSGHIDPARRQFLLAATSLLGAVGVAGASLPFILSWKPSARARALGGPVKVHLGRLLPGELKVVEWRRQPIYIVRHTDESMRTLALLQERLDDPESEKSKQPDYVLNENRALRPDIGVLVGLCTHLGCAPSFLPEERPEPFDSKWLGGFFCPCHGSKFDLAGRVYRNTPAPTNLTIPSHHFADEQTLVIGEDPPV